jgi:glutamyl-tRNA synthetase
MPTPRLRFPPSPSGWLHVGGARTALYNWLWARRTGGAFVVRIEDTDAERVSDASELGMLDALRWLGLDWDEGPGVDGPHGPYRQSDRYPLYSAVVDRLLKAGAAYDAYETPEELAAKREAAQREGRPPGYDGAHRDLSDEERDVFLTEGRRPTIRLRTPDEGTVSFDDHIRGRIDVPWADVPDFVIQRADGTPTYYLANAVDDLAMGINLVARGEDLLSATPRQLLLTDLLLADGLLDEVLAAESYPARPEDAVRPTYAHLPIIVGADRKKLSKRHGDVAIDEYRRQGYLPETMVNFLALCGWSWDATTERMDVDELVARFSFDRVGRNPAFFDADKLRSMNGDRIKDLGDGELAERLQPHFEAAGLVVQPPEPEHARLLLGLAPLLRERIQTLAEAVPMVRFAFSPEVEYDDKAVAKHLRPPADRVLALAEERLGGLEEWTAEGIHAVLDGIADEVGVGRGKAFQPVRVAVTGTAVSPPLPETLALLDRDLVLRRLHDAARLAPPAA